MTAQFRLKLVIVFAVIAGAMALRTSSAQTTKVDFVRDIQPILQATCWRCHNEQTAKGQLRLDNKTAAMKGGISGAVIIPGNGRDSRLLHRVRGEGGEKRMPLGGETLSSAQIELIKSWIEQGANWPEVESAIRNPQSPSIGRS